MSSARGIYQPCSVGEFSVLLTIKCPHKQHGKQGQNTCTLYMDSLYTTFRMCALQIISRKPLFNNSRWLLHFYHEIYFQIFKRFTTDKLYWQRYM